MSTQTAIATDAEITRHNADDVRDALIAEQDQLSRARDVATSHAERAALYRRYAINQERQALALERRPGRQRDKYEPAAQHRHEARLAEVVAVIEHVRASAAAQGRELPDPLPLISQLAPRVSGNDEAVQTVLALYNASMA